MHLDMIVDDLDTAEAAVIELGATNRLARLSATERMQIIDDFKAEVFGGLDIEPSLRDQIRDLRIELPDDPTPEQVDSWIELAELVQDPVFRARMRSFLELNTPVPGQSKPSGARIWWARQVVNTVAEARERESTPPGPPRPNWFPTCSAMLIWPPCWYAWRQGSRRARNSIACLSPDLRSSVIE